MKASGIKKLSFSLIASAAFTAHSCTLAPSAITYSLSGGRLGDNLLAYAKAKWLALKYNLPLIYKPFEYADQLVLHDYEMHKSPATKTVVVRNENDVKISRASDTLYVFSYYSQVQDWTGSEQGFRLLKHSPQFYATLRQLIKPKRSIPLLQLPNDKITVALHVRKGGGFDKALLNEEQDLNKVAQMTLPELKRNYTDFSFPLKVPPDSFFITELQKLSELYGDQPMYVYLFTDSQNPTQLKNFYKQQVNKPAIEFACRTTMNRHNANVLEDLFNMTKFHCLIRGDSSYAKAAELITDYEVVIYPTQAEWRNFRSTITHSEVVDKRKKK